jgi:hypothetical protein
MTKRQPKGTPVGGQFAQDRKPSGGDLTHTVINYTVIATSRHVDIDDDHVPSRTFNRMRTDDWDDEVEPDIVVQAFSVEAVNISDAEGWTPTGIALVLRERGVTTATEDDIYEMFDPSEVESISFDPKRGVDRVLQEVNKSLASR